MCDRLVPITGQESCPVSPERFTFLPVDAGPQRRHGTDRSQVLNPLTAGVSPGPAAAVRITWDGSHKDGFHRHYTGASGTLAAHIAEIPASCTARLTQGGV